ncbi:cysteine desulfurase [Paenibacillus sp. GSMTC-2017]|uniref:cysteine desulfurase family protein n=1 Tax=Paenibacillus sp. GSMTC-2017 TaxID=2794350 RepID=UPI0018D70718|nr:cysteine desulfurase family protein [Paenibacillus sp. GSMTC-2017]MBH5316932.1 cysteine desulfurase [Paenibacillus sp. GSMTC-2017]
MLYFDHSASTPPYEEVIETMVQVMRKHYANPSSLHAGGLEAAGLIGRSRALIADQLGTTKGSWLFTSGGTESNNLAIKGVAKQYRSRGNHIITTGIEHASIHEAMKQLESEGYRVTYLPVSSSGHVNVEDVRAALTKETILVSIMHVNNEIGTIQPIEEIGQLLKDYPKTLFHVDAVQSLGKIPLDPDSWGIDLVSGSAHKLRGPRGVGFLYVREGVKLTPLSSGGSHELGFRSGTENVPAIVASAKALRMSVEGSLQRNIRMKQLSQQLRTFIESKPELKLNGTEPLASHIIHFSYPGMKPEVIVHMLEQNGIIASTKSACSSKENKPSRVLLALGASEMHAAGGIRISLGDEHEDRHIEELSLALTRIIGQLKPLERGSNY